MSDAYDDEDEFMVDDEVYDIEYSSDDEEESGDYQFENIYYGAKSIKDEDWRGAVDKFKEVIASEQDKSEWGFKCHKQICKLYFRNKRYADFLKTFKSLTEYVDNAITRNYSEKSLYSILEYVSAVNANTPVDTQFELYNLILVQLGKGALPHERLWFKTQLKLGKLYLQERKFVKVASICTRLNDWCEKTGQFSENTDETDSDLKNIIQNVPERKASLTTGLNNSRQGGNLLEVYALEIQMCTEQRNNKRLKELYTRALSVKSAICNALDQGIIRECGGKMHLREMAYDSALTDFFEAFKCYDECGSARRIQSIKYVVLASMLSNSDINPFDSQEAKPYKINAEVKTMTQLVDTYQQKDSIQFEKVLNDNLETLKKDDFIWEYTEKLCKNIRIESIVNICRQNSNRLINRILVDDLASRMCVSRRNAEQAIIHALLESRIEGAYDQVNGILQVVNTQGNTAKKIVVEASKNDECDSQPKTENKSENSLGANSSTAVDSTGLTTSVLEPKEKGNLSGRTNGDRVVDGMSRMIGKWAVTQENLQNKLILDMLNNT